jgi:hypothetical protein
MKSTATKLTAKLRSITSEELGKLKDSVILQHEGGYIIFDKFRLKIEDDVYNVYTKGNDLLETFYASASAVSWCMAITSGRYVVADDIVKADAMLNNRKNEHEFYLMRISTAKTDERRGMYRAKWEENYTRLKHSQEEMRKLLSLAKYYYSL